MKRFILFLLVGAMLLLPLSGCLADNKQNEGTTPNNTTENTTPESTTPEATTPPENDQNDLVPPEPSYAISAQAPTEWEIANGDIPILLSFGLKEGCSSNSELFSNIIFEFWNSEKQTYVFKKIDIAEIEKPEYVVEYVYDEERQIVGFNYAHTEEVELPLSMFSADSGYITIAMIEWEDDGTEKGASGAGGGTILYYKRNGENTLIISDKPISESTTPDNPPEVTTPEVTTSPENDQKDPPPAIVIPPEGNKNHPPVVEGEIDKDSELIETLSAFLDYYNILWDKVNISFSAQINAIKNGTQPLHVVFDANDYYYVCAYYAPTHDKEESAYCCFSEYTWVAYKSETAIQEFHNGMQFVVAFQINRAASVINILTGEPANDIEHFDIYVPAFENGVNTAVATEFDQNFVYLNGLFSDLDENTIYYSTSPKSVKDHSNHAIPCVYLGGRYYLSLSLGTLKSGREFDAQEVLSKESNIYKFGEYYDAIVGVMDMESYRIVNQDGSMRIYGLITFEDFVSEVVK